MGKSVPAWLIITKKGESNNAFRMFLEGFSGTEILSTFFLASRPAERPGVTAAKNKTAEHASVKNFVFLFSPSIVSFSYHEIIVF